MTTDPEPDERARRAERLAASMAMTSSECRQLEERGQWAIKLAAPIRMMEECRKKLRLLDEDDEDDDEQERTTPEDLAEWEKVVARLRAKTVGRAYTE